jgi:CubicO group peptidase (beta-lactamase class C family)
MNINLIFKSLLAAALLSSLSSFTVASAEENNGPAPEATAAEAELSFRDIPYLDKAFIDATPANRKDGILVGELGVDGGNKNMIVKLAKEIADYKHGPYDSLLIVQKGKLLFESYYSRGRVNLPHYQASATKAYTGFALGRAIQMGYLSMADLDKPLVSFLKDLDPTKFVEGAKTITLNHALTMRSGIRISDEQRKEFKKNPSQLKGQGEVQALLEHSAPITEESQSFKYGGGAGLIMQVIDAVVPGSAKDFIKNELLDKMGITTYRWRTNGVTGLPESGHSSAMTSRNMIKWGILAMNKGKWNDEQLIPEAFIAKATSRLLYPGNHDVFGGGKDVSKQGYGYFWWSADLKVGNKSYFSASAQGGNGQFIILIEELDLLFVVTDDDNDNSTLQITAERILPAFIQNSIPTLGGKSDSQDKFSVLEGPYLGQEPPGLTPEVFAPDIVPTEHRAWGGSFTPQLTKHPL